jgi:hypothetical protein
MRANLGRAYSLAESKDCDRPRNTDDLLVRGLVDHDCGTRRGLLMPQQPTAKAFGCRAALMSTAEGLQRVLSRTESLSPYDAKQIASLQSPDAKIARC